MRHFPRSWHSTTRNDSGRSRPGARRVARSGPGLIVGLAALLALATPARGQENLETTPLEEIDRHASGETIRIDGHYVELRDQEMILFGSPARIVVPTAEARRETFAAAAQGARVVLEARVDESGARPSLTALHVRGGRPAKEEFVAAIERLRASGDRGERLFRLAARAREYARAFPNAEVGPLVETATLAAYQLAASSLGAKDVQGRVDLALRAFEASQDRRVALGLLGDIDRDAGGSSEARAEIARLGGRSFRGRWMLEEDFKREQGFQEFHGHWVSAREKDFLEAVLDARRQDPHRLLRNRTDEEYRLLAGRGEIALGMKQEEAYHALGFADRVYREILDGKEYDQWVYPSRYLYFEEGFLTRVTQLTGS